MEEDNILADILCELDGNKSNVVGATPHSNSSLKAIQEEKKAINDYMASFSKNALKSKREIKEVDGASDDVRNHIALQIPRFVVINRRSMIVSGNLGEDLKTSQSRQD